MFYIYENWTAHKKAKIHKGSCSHCNNGKGTHKNIHGNKNGEWHRPFNSYSDAYKFAIGLNNRKVSDCNFCLKYKK